MIVRVATADDADALAVVHVHTSQEAYRGQFPQAHLDQLDLSRRRQIWAQHLRSDHAPTGTLVAEHPVDGVVGFIYVSPCRDSDTDSRRVGEIQAVYVLPKHWGQGVGKLLMEAGLCRLAEAGYREMVLWVLESNERARRFYEAGGWRADGSSRTDDSRGMTVTEVRYRHHQRDT
ncbi:GNAT family N-acetyltransferase [Actinoplanes sp. NEAU-A11]|uniref:GNAT family N-acetyltransferase n=1 Tax=Actinoplanes aureus TaxID=2792083 RepID=A0A931G3M4_9ACTN|nr:GNAT family N-acetyltransferase [Actinoplanes aureus]